MDIRRVPSALIALRVALGPLLLMEARSHVGPPWIVLTLLAAMLSDVFDGVIARRLNIATERLRVADSYADAWFFVCLGASAWVASSEVVRAVAAPLLVQLVLQIFSYGFDLARYRRITSLHAYSAKIWGFSLYVAATALIAFGYGGLVWLTLVCSLASFVDALAIKLILPGWRHDILSFRHAIRIRGRECQDAPEYQPFLRSPRLKSGFPRL